MAKLQNVLGELAALEIHTDSKAAAAVKVEVILSMPNSSVAVLTINEKIVVRDADGKATVALKPGEYQMDWRVIGAKNTEYSVGILSPDRLKFEPDPPFRTDSTGFGGNQVTFMV